MSFIVLQNGIYIDNISFPNIKAKQLYIKWDEKISITVEKIDLKNTSEQDSKIQIQKIDMILKEIILFDTIFKKVLINKIKYNNITGSFKYFDGGDGYLNLSSSDFSLKSSLFFESHLFNIKIKSFIDKKNEIKANGNIILNTYSDIELLASLNIKILDDVNIHLYSRTDLDKLSYKIESLNNIKSIKPIIDKYASNWKAKWWVRDAIDMSSLTINNIYGYLEYENIKDAYKRLHVEAVVNDLKYTYNKKLDVIDTSHTELEFKDGILYIRPKNAYTYKTFLDKSQLNINFTKEETVVYLHLFFRGMLNKDLLYLLSVYSIDLPFTQTKGELKTDLKLDINLNTTDVEAHGTFYTNNSWINYLGLDLHVFNTNVILNNTNVSVKNMYAKYEDIATSHLDIIFDAKKDIGKLDFRVDNVSFTDIGVKLKNDKHPLHVEYIINPKQDYIDIENSKWAFDGESFNIDKMRLPFNLEELSVAIPSTKVYSQNTLDAFASGKVLFKPIRADIDLDITNLFHYNTRLNQKQLDLKVKYDNKLTISSKSNISLKTSKDIYNINDLNITIDNRFLNIKNMSLSIDNLLASNITINYDFDTDEGYLDLNTIDVSNKTFNEIFKKDEKIKLKIKALDNNIIITSKKYDIKYILNDYEWKVSVNSIKNIAKESKVLKDYFIDDGSFRMGKKYNENFINFLFKGKYKYSLIVENNEPIDDYAVSGKYHTKKDFISININNIVHVAITDKIKIKAKKIGFHLVKIVKFISDLNTSENKDSMGVYMDSKDSYVYFSENRHAVADSIKFNYINKILSADFIHKKGKATFKYENNKFVLKGKNFGDEFMNQLFALSEVRGGKLGFSVAGVGKTYKGVMYMKDATIIDYSILNNVLAFVNTVPALLTFKLPGYNKSGLDIKRLYFDFDFQDDIYNISNFSISSKEINILGKGEASIVNDTINMDMNLKTDLGSSVSKIPIVGYILLGEDSVSTSLTLTGKLSNPQVNTQVAQDIAVAPWNILKRTFTYPMKLFESDDK